MINAILLAAASYLPLMAVNADASLLDGEATFVSAAARATLDAGGSAYCMDTDRSARTAYTCLTREEWKKAIGTAASVKRRDMIVSQSLFVAQSD